MFWIWIEVLMNGTIVVKPGKAWARMKIRSHAKCRKKNSIRGSRAVTPTTQNKFGILKQNNMNFILLIVNFTIIYCLINSWKILFSDKFGRTVENSPDSRCAGKGRRADEQNNHNASHLLQQPHTSAGRTLYFLLTCLKSKYFASNGKQQVGPRLSVCELFHEKLGYCILRSCVGAVVPNRALSEFMQL